MPPADLDGSGNAVDAALEQPAIEPEPQEAAAADSAAGVFYLWLLAQQFKLGWCLNCPHISSADMV